MTEVAAEPLEPGDSAESLSKSANSKPLARSRSSTPSEEGHSRKRHRPASPSNDPAEGDLRQPSEAENKTPEDVSKPPEPVDESVRKEDSEVPATAQAEQEHEEGEVPESSAAQSSDGWEAIWEPGVGAYYFYNHNTSETTWTNPRVPPSEAEAEAEAENPVSSKPYTGYDPSIHGDYDPNAAYAQQPERTPSPTIDPYAAQAAFNRFTGKFQAGPGAESVSDESRARRQMEIFFDVDAAANCHDGRSLKAERQAKKLTKKEVKAFREKTRLKKEEKKRAWLRD